MDSTQASEIKELFELTAQPRFSLLFLARASVYDQKSKVHKVYLGSLRPEHTISLLALPEFVFFNILMTLENDYLQRVIQDSLETPGTISYPATNIGSILDSIRFATDLNAPPFKDKHPEALHLAVLNFLALWFILHETLAHGVVPSEFSLSDMDIDDMLDTWRNHIVNAILNYAERRIQLVKTEIENGDTEIGKIFEKLGSEYPCPIIPTPIPEQQLDRYIFKMFDVGISGFEEELYTLLVRFSDQREPIIIFIPKWDLTDHNNNKLKLISCIKNLEIDVRLLTKAICQDWRHFAKHLEKYAMRDQDNFIAWWRATMKSEAFREVSLNYKALARGLVTLELEVPKNQRIEHHSKTYKQHWKRHIPPQVLQSLWRAASEIEWLFHIVKSIKNPTQKQRTAKEYFEANQSKDQLFRELTLEDVTEIVFDDSHGTRDPKNLILPRVAQRHGLQLSARRIEKLLRKTKVL